MTTPATALAQGIFDIVVGKAAKMPKQCRANGVCTYRDGQGNACFGGHVLSDEQAAPNGKLLSGSIQVLARNSLLPDYLVPHVVLLGDLQRVHEFHENWMDRGEGPPNMVVMRKSLLGVAITHKLNTRVLDEHFPATA